MNMVVKLNAYLLLPLPFHTVTRVVLLGTSRQPYED